MIGKRRLVRISRRCPEPGLARREGPEDLHFEAVGPIREVETIAVGGRIPEIMRLVRQFGPGRWKKGVATVRLNSGNLRTAELHWYEAHGIGRRKMKIEALLD